MTIIGLKIKELRKHVKLNQVEFSASFGIDNSQLSKIEQGKLMPTLNQLLELSSIYEKSLDWFTGKEEEKSNLITVQEAKEIYSPKRIPLYDGVITASKIEADMTPLTEPVEFIDAGDWFRDATSAMRVHGDSMPQYPSGSIIALKEVNDKSLLMYGQDYGFETSEYRTIKRVQKGNSSDSLLMCSDNIERWEDGSERGRLIHEPFDVKIDEIRRIFLVLGCVRRNHSSRIVYNSSSSV